MGSIGDLLHMFFHPSLMLIHLLIFVTLELMIIYGVFDYWWLIPLFIVVGILFYPLFYMSWENGFIKH